MPMNPALEHYAQFAGDMFSLTPPDAPGAHFCGALFTAGGQKFPAGAADLDAAHARIRCLGEVAETIAQFAAPDDLEVRPAGYGLGADEFAALLALAYDDAGPFLAATRLSDQHACSIPASLCLRSVQGRSTAATSLGAAAGQTRQDAIRSALFELIERDAIALWWHGGMPAMEIPETNIMEAATLLAQARRGLDGRKVRFLALQSIGQAPVVCAMSADLAGKAAALGFAASGSFRQAAVKALMELLQMEVGNRIVSMKAERLGSENFGPADAHLWQRFTTLDASMLPFQTEGAVEPAPDLTAETIIQTLAASGVQVYAADLFRGQALPVVKLFAPALQPLPGKIVTERLACSKKTHLKRLRHFPKVAVL